MNNYSKPTKKIVSEAQAKLWSPHRGLIQRKADGEFKAVELAFTGGSECATIACEFMKRRSGQFLAGRDEDMFKSVGEFYYAFDILEYNHSNLEEFPFSYRWGVLTRLYRQFASNMVLINSQVYMGTAEGLCFKEWSAPYVQPFECWKVLSDHICRVSKIGGSQSVEIEEVVSSEVFSDGYTIERTVSRGRVKIPAHKIDKIRVGSLVKVNAMGLTDAGKFREPRLDSDTETSWLVKV